MFLDAALPISRFIKHCCWNFGQCSELHTRHSLAQTGKVFFTSKKRQWEGGGLKSQGAHFLFLLMLSAGHKLVLLELVKLEQCFSSKGWESAP